MFQNLIGVSSQWKAKTTSVRGISVSVDFSSVEILRCSVWEKEKISVTDRIVLFPIYILFSYKGASYTDPCYDNIFSNFVITNDTEYTIKNTK